VNTVAEVSGKTTDQPVTALSQLPQLFNRLFDQLQQLLNTQVALFKLEFGETIKRYGQGALFATCAAVIAFLGFTLLSIALVFWLDFYINNQAASFALVGALYFVGGLATAIVLGKKLVAQSSLLPQTKEELQKDKQWIKTETHQAT